MKFSVVFLGTFFIILNSCKVTKDNNLNILLDDYWEFTLSEYPFFATSCGDLRFNDQVPVISEQAEKLRNEKRQSFHNQLLAVNVEDLTTDERINYSFLKLELENQLADYKFGAHYMPFNSDESFHTNFIHSAGSFPFKSKIDYENYITRLSGFEKYIDGHIDLMRAGLKKGISQPKFLLDGHIEGLPQFITDLPEEHSAFKPFKKIANSVSAADQKLLTEKAKSVISETVIPGFAKLAAFFKEEYYPNARESIGISELPGGKEFYEAKTRYYTTLEMTPDEIFELGQKEVARIQAEMDSIILSVAFKGSFADFVNFLRTDEQFYAKTPEQLLERAAWISKSIDGKLPEFFNLLPRLPYGVQPVPEAIAPRYTTGRYSPGSPENHKAGNYWVNTYKVESRPLYALPALTLHEAVPGHHLQIALAQEQEATHPFLQNTYLSAYGEGWALYTEFLGKEMGIYSTPYENFGALTYEMWRACRLVVDVGMHYKGWSRQKAFDFMASNTALSLHNVGTETDRYIGWPAQALSYKIGELKIRELRIRSTKKLGDKFDLSTFHDLVLSKGSVPLFALEKMVDDWIFEMSQ